MPSMDLKTTHPETIAAQALGWIDEATRAITPPIHVSSTYLRDPDNQYRSGRVYARADNPAFAHYLDHWGDWQPPDYE